MRNKVLIESIDLALKPLKKSIIDQYFDLYCVHEDYDENNIGLKELLDFAYCIYCEVEADENEN